MADKKYLYFFYSDEQISEKKEILEQSGKEFIPGYVVVGNQRKKITQISTSKTAMSRYIDTVLVAEGSSNEMNYSEPQSITKRRGMFNV